MGTRLTQLLTRLGFLKRSEYISPQWLKDCRRQHHIDQQLLDGPVWHWPIQKMRDTHGRFNRERLRRRA